MDLLERYLQAVRTYLPKSQQDDIVKELSENLRSQMDDSESELGRPLSDTEVGEMLKKHGHPLVVAMRYRQSRYLIGPTLFPVYWFAVKIILALMGFGYAVGALVMIAQGQSIVAVLGALFGFVGALLPAFGWITVVFAVLDLSNSKLHILEKLTNEHNRKFDPFSLPKVRPLASSEAAKPIPRSKTVFELFFSIAFLLWWVRVDPIRRLALFIALGPVGLANKIPFQFGPVWGSLYFPVILFTSVAILQQMITLVYPERIAFYSLMRLLSNSFNLIFLSILVRSNEILVVSPGVQNPSQLGEPLRIVNLVLHYVFLFTIVLTVVECFKQLRRLVQLWRGPSALPAL